MWTGSHVYSCSRELQTCKVTGCHTHTHTHTQTHTNTHKNTSRNVCRCREKVHTSGLSITLDQGDTGVCVCVCVCVLYCDREYTTNVFSLTTVSAATANATASTAVVANNVVSLSVRLYNRCVFLASC